MTKSSLETVHRMLESVVEEIDDPDASYKLRTAMQLLVFIEDRKDEALSAIEETGDEELVDRLRDLGYIE